MHVIRYAADGFGQTVERANHAAEISVQSVSPSRGNERFVVFGSENEMVMKAQMGG